MEDSRNYAEYSAGEDSTSATDHQYRCCLLGLKTSSSTSARHNFQLGTNAEGIFLAERIFGVAIRNSQGKDVPVRYIGEQHVREDLGRIPSFQDWAMRITPEPWMYGQKLTKTSQF